MCFSIIVFVMLSWSLPNWWPTLEFSPKTGLVRLPTLNANKGVLTKVKIKVKKQLKGFQLSIYSNHRVFFEVGTEWQKRARESCMSPKGKR